MDLSSLFIFSFGSRVIQAFRTFLYQLSLQPGGINVCLLEAGNMGPPCRVFLVSFVVRWWSQ